jgi:hypothetical protein
MGSRERLTTAEGRDVSYALSEDAALPLSRMASGAGSRATLALAASALVEVIAASVLCADSAVCTSFTAYSVVAGALALLGTFPLLALHYSMLPPWCIDIVLPLAPHISALLVLWTVPAWFILTFISPFTGLSNGYFACLGMLISSLSLGAVNIPLLGACVTAHAEHTADVRSLLALAMTSSVVWCEATMALLNRNFADANRGYEIWAIVVGVGSLVLCLFALVLRTASDATSHSTYMRILACWWCQGVAITFMPAPQTLNSYLALWASALLAFYHATPSFHRRGVYGPPDSPPTPPPEDFGTAAHSTAYVAASTSP